MIEIIPIILISLVILIIAPFIISLLSILFKYYHHVRVDAAAPEDYGLTVESMAYTSLDGISLNTYWVKPELMKGQKSSGIVLILHDHDTDASSMLGHASFLKKLDYHIIVPDMRAHGVSSGIVTGLAIEELRDIFPLLDWIQGQKDLLTLPVALCGVGMGGAAAIRIAALRPDVSAVISISSFASLDLLIHDPESGANALVKLLSRIHRFYANLVIKMLYGQTMTEASPLQDIDQIAPRPVLIIHGGKDTKVPVRHADMLVERGGENVTPRIFEDAGQGVYTGDGTGSPNKRYRRVIWDFLQQNLEQKDFFSFDVPVSQESAEET